VVEADVKTTGLRNFNQLLSHLWAQRLSALVVANVALGATEVLRNGLLRQPKAQTDGFEMVHRQILALLVRVVNMGAILHIQQQH
jgi:hypothetical protein